jgi:recombination protein RecR
MNAINNLTNLLTRLPGVGKKSAQRLSYFILENDESYAQSLAAALSALHRSIRRCSVCGAWTEEDPCPICCDPRRDASLLCVVERPQDIQAIEDSREYNGRFHVLGGLIAPLDGVTADKLTIGRLLVRARREQIREVILALNPTVEGDTTALFIQNQLKDAGAEVTRLASGLPAGGDLEYADRLTLSKAFRGRVKI